MSTAPAGVLQPRDPLPSPIRRVLCPIDFSDFSPAAAQEASLLAQAAGSEIVALFVFPIPTAWLDAAGTAPAEPESGVKSVVAQDLAALFAPARAAGTPVSCRVEVGDPARRIVEVAAGMRADAVVMGTHGRSGFERWVLGSVASKVLRTAPCPVLTVARPLAEPSSAVGAPERGGILCAVDLSPSSRRTVAHALSRGRWTGSAVTLLHVLEGAVVKRGRRLLEDEALQRLRELRAAAGGAEEDADDVVAAGKPYREILRVAEERHCALIVMGIHGRDPEDGMFFGSTADHVVRRAAVPVLTVRALRPVDADAPSDTTWPRERRSSASG